MPDPTDGILRHFPTLLRRWDGAIARMWQLTTSHKTLLLRLEQHGRVGNLEIACIDPEFIQGPTEWNDARIVIAPCSDGFSVTDVSAGVDIRAGHVEVKENVKPLNAFTIASIGGSTG